MINGYIVAVIAATATIIVAVINYWATTKKKELALLPEPKEPIPGINNIGGKIIRTVIKGGTLKSNISQYGKNNLIIGRDNKAPINVGDTYTSPSQRHVNKEELEEIVKASPEKDSKIKVFSNGSIEGNTFRDEILSELAKRGYSKLIQAVIGMNINVFCKGRLTIKPGSYGAEKYLEVIVNPQ